MKKAGVKKNHQKSWKKKGVKKNHPKGWKKRGGGKKVGVKKYHRKSWKKVGVKTKSGCYKKPGVKKSGGEKILLEV